MALNFPLGLPTHSYSASCTLPLYSGRSFPFDFQVSLLTNTGIRNFGEFKSPANADFRNGEHLLKSQLDSTTRSLQHDLSDSHFNAADTLLSMKNSAMYRAGLNCQSTWTLSAPPLVSDFGPTTVDAQRVKDATQFHNYGVISRNNMLCANNMSQRYLVTSGRRESGADIPAQKKPIESDVEKIHHQCNVCNKTYGCSSALKTHLKLHSGEKAFKCQDCGKIFSQQANLKAHLRTHSGEKPFQCKVCKRRFAQSSSVTTHMRTHSGERPYQCTICGRGFADSSTLTKHIRVHTGERPYKCDVCHTKFSQSGNLKRHMSVHKKVMSIATLE